MATNKPMGSGWKIRRGEPSPGGEPKKPQLGQWEKLSSPGSRYETVVAKKPPMDKWEKVSGSTTTKTSVAKRSPYGGQELQIVNGRVVGPSERARQPENWMTSRAVPGVRASNVRNYTEPSEAPKAPKVSTTARIPKAMGTSPQRISDSQAQAFRQAYPNAGEGFDIAVSKEEDRRIMGGPAANAGATSYGQGTAAPETRMVTPTTTGLGLTPPKLKEPGTGLETPMKWAATGAVAYGSYKGTKAAGKQAWKGVSAVTGRTARKAAAAKTSIISSRLGALSAPSPGPQAAGASPTGRAPTVQPKGAANTGMPARSPAAVAANTITTPVEPTPQQGPLGALLSSRARGSATSNPPAGTSISAPSAQPSASAASPPNPAPVAGATAAAGGRKGRGKKHPAGVTMPSPAATAESIAKGVQAENLASEQAEATARAGKVAEAETLAKNIQAESRAAHPSGVTIPKPTAAPAPVAPVGKKAKESASKAHGKQTLERFGAEAGVEAVSKLRAEVPHRAAAPGVTKAVSAADVQLRSSMEAMAGKTVNVAPGVDIKTPTTTSMPKPSKSAGKIPAGVVTPKPPETTPEAPPTPSKAGHTTFSPEQQRTADDMYRELSRLKNESFSDPESLEKKQAYEGKRAEAKDWVIKQGGVRLEADASLQLPKPKTVTPPRPISDLERSRAEMYVSAEKNQEARSAERAKARRFDPAFPFETPAGFKPGVETAPADEPKMSNQRKKEDKRIRTSEAGREAKTRGLLGELYDVVASDKLARRQQRAEAAMDIEDLLTRPRQADKPMGVAARPLGAAAKQLTAPFPAPRTRMVTADTIPSTPRPSTSAPSLEFLHTPGVRAAQLQEESGKKRSRAARARKVEIGRLQAEEAQRQGLPPQPSAAELRAKQAGEMGGISEQSQAERDALKAIGERAEKLRQTQVGGSAIVETPEKAQARAARKAQIEAHMKTKGYTRIETGLGEAHVVAGAEPTVTRVASASTSPTPESAPPKAPKVGKGKKLPTDLELPKPSAAAQAQAQTPADPQAAGATPGEAPPVEKKPGRFRLPKEHGTGNTKGKGKGKGNIILGALFAAGAAAEAAQAAEPGKVGQDAWQAAKSEASGIGAEAAKIYAMSKIPVIGAPAAAGYMGIQGIRGLPRIKVVIGQSATEGAKALGAVWAAHRERHASEAKWGESQYRAAISKQAAKVSKKARSLL